MKTSNTFEFIDLFCGVGGIHLGMKNAGFKCVFSCDINDDCKKVYFENFKELPKGDIKLINEKSIPNHHILCADFPCQPFSISGKQKGFADTRGTMFFEVCRIIKEKKPSVVMLDEPTNHLDIFHQLYLMETLRALNKTIVAVFHDLNLAAQFCDYLYVLKDGSIVAKGPPKHILTIDMFRTIFNISVDIIDNNGKPHIIYQNAHKE